MYSYAASVKPPLHPWAGDGVHEVVCCGASSMRTWSPDDSTSCDSTASVAEKAQQLPHWPWFLMAVTALVNCQSSAAGGLARRVAL